MLSQTSQLLVGLHVTRVFSQKRQNFPTFATSKPKREFEIIIQPITSQNGVFMAGLWSTVTRQLST